MKHTGIMATLAVCLLLVSAFGLGVIPPEPGTMDSSGEYTTSGDFDGGYKSDTTTSNDRYNQTAGTLELNFPYADKDPNLVSYWPLDNALTDVEGGNTFVNMGATGSATGGPYIYDGHYNFATDYMYNGDASLDITTEHTATIWVNRDTTSGIQTIISKNVDLGNSRIVLRMDVDSIFCQFYGTTHGQYHDVSYVFGTGTWRMLSVVLSVTENRFGIYVDGTPIFTGVLTDYSDLSVGTDEMEIGRDDRATNYFDGSLSNFKWYDRALSDAEVLALYNSGNKYKSSGNWTTPTISPPGGDTLNNITIDLNNSWSGVDIDQIDIIYSSNDTIMSSHSADITLNGTTVLTGADFDNDFTYTNYSFKINITLEGDGDNTPIIQRVNYTTTGGADSTAPLINSITETTDPTEYNTHLNITANITDETAMNTVYLNISHPNGTYWTNTSMTNGTGDNYHDNHSYSSVGWYNYTIWTNDTTGNFNYSARSFNITDTTAPVFNWTSRTPLVIIDPGRCNHSVQLYDHSTISAVYLNITYPDATTSNTSMIYYSGNNNYSLDPIYAQDGIHEARVWATDQYGNMNNAWLNFSLAIQATAGGSTISKSFGFEYEINIRTVYFTYIGDPATHHDWSFGDGYGSNDTDPIYQYSQPGFYNVTLEVTFNNGAKMWSTQQIEIIGSGEVNTLSGGRIPIDKAGALLIGSGMCGICLLMFRYNPMSDIFSIIRRETMFRIYGSFMFLGIILLIVSRVYNGG